MAGPTYSDPSSLDHLGVLDRFVDVLKDAYFGRNRYLEIIHGVRDWKPKELSITVVKLESLKE